MYYSEDDKMTDIETTTTRSSRQMEISDLDILRSSQDLDNLDYWRGRIKEGGVWCYSPHIVVCLLTTTHCQSCGPIIRQSATAPQ